MKTAKVFLSLHREESFARHFAAPKAKDTRKTPNFLEPWRARETANCPSEVPIQ